MIGPDQHVRHSIEVRGHHAGEGEVRLGWVGWRDTGGGLERETVLVVVML